jgi:NhaP-type Na+/H+ or K+/H+ antiporter
VNKNLDNDIKLTGALLVQLLAHLSETACFVLLGLSIFLVQFPVQLLPFMLTILCVCFGARVLTVYPLLCLVR